MKRTLSTAFYQPNNNTDINDDDADMAGEANNDPAPKPVPPTMHVRNATPDPIGPSGPSQATPVHAFGPITQPLLISRGQTAESQQASESTQQISMQAALAARDGDLPAVQAFLSNGADVNVGDNDGWTALMYASKKGHLTTVQALLGVSGINIDVQKSDGVTALYLAALNGNYDVVKALIDKGADVNVGDNSGWTALMSAAENGHMTTVQALLGVSGIDIHAKKSNGGTALIVAAAHGKDDIVKALIDKGADVNVGDEDGWTALMYASKKGHLTTVQTLLGVSGINIDVQNSNGATALSLAALNGNYDVLKALIDKGADVNVGENDGWTALMGAAENGHMTTVQALLSAPGIDINAKTRGQYTALTVAAANGKEHIVKALINKGADVNAADNDGWTALIYASKKGHLTTVQALLDVSGIDINAKDCDGETALYLAALKGNNDVVKALINKGADVNFDGADDWTALMKYLAQRQADVGNLYEEATWASTFATSAIPPKASEEVIPSPQALALDTLIQQAQVEGPSLLQISFQATRDQLLQHKLSAAQVATLISTFSNGPFATALLQTLALAIKLGGYYKKSDLNLIHEKLNVFGLFDAYKKSRSRLVPKNINRWQVSGQTLLTRAAQAGDQLLVDALINCGAALHLPDQHGNNALLAAVKAGKWSVCGHLLSLGANPNTSDRSGVSTLTYLAQAFAKEDEQTAAFTVSLLAPLLAKGYRLDRTVKNPDSSKFWETTTILKILRSDLNRYALYAHLLNTDGVNHADNHGNTALMLAAENGDLATVQALLSAPGIDIDTKKTNGATA